MNIKDSILQIKKFFDPKTVAIVGASEKIEKAGGIIFRNFIENKKRGIFKGEVYPVNPYEKEILGYKCYPSILDIPNEIDLVVIVIPAQLTLKIVEQAIEKKVKNIIIISSGYSEIGNYELEQKIKEMVKKSGIRLLGPNCLGVYDPSTGVDTLFLPETKLLANGREVVSMPRPMLGRIGFISQSGAFGVAALDYLTGKQIGISRFISFGNRADVDEVEILEYFLEDNETKVILMYIENIVNGRRFIKIASEVTKKKPIVAIKTGKTEAGARAALSHTGALAGSDKVYDGVFKQVGILRAENMHEFFNIAKALVLQPPAEGKNIGIITDAGGPGVMASDECEIKGMNVKKFSEETINKLNELKKDKIIPEFATISNPIDLTGSVTSEMYENCTRILLEDPEINGIIIIGLHHTPALGDDFIDRIANISKKYLKPIVACDIGETEMALYIRQKFDKHGIPSYSSPEEAVQAMNGLVKYGLYLKKIGAFEKYLNEYKKVK